MTEPTAWPEVPNESATAVLVPGPGHRDVTAPRSWSARTVAVILAMVALASAAGVAAWIAFTNKSRADRWQARSVELQHNVDALNGVVVRRTALLNARVAQLNVMARKVTEAQGELTRSEGDVQSLEARQRELANEKAQLEDERSALTQVANAFITCKGDLENALQAIGDSDWSWIDTYGPTVRGDCDDADSSLQGFLSAYPNG